MDIVKLSAVEIAEKIKNKEISCEEIVKAFIDVSELSAW